MLRGDPVELKWNERDLESLETVIGITMGRHAAVQAGGCLGVFAKRLAREFRAVYVFEPSTQFIDMTHNAPEKNIIRIQAALGHEAGMVNPVCSLPERKKILHGGMTHMERGGIVPTMTLDSLELPHCDLLYLDIEGWEYWAILGAHRTIIRCRPVIVVEVNSAIERIGIAPDMLRQLIVSQGYKKHSQLRSDEVYVPC